MGFGINKLKQALQEQSEFNVLVTILTDGAENASKEFSGNDVKKLVEELKQNHWTLTYIGTDHDVEKIALSMSINNTLVFNKNEKDINLMFMKERLSRTNYSSRISRKKDTQSNYFEDPEDDKKPK